MSLGWVVTLVVILILWVVFILLVVLHSQHLKKSYGPSNYPAHLAPNDILSFHHS